MTRKHRNLALATGVVVACIVVTSTQFGRTTSSRFSSIGSAVSDGGHGCGACPSSPGPGDAPARPAVPSSVVPRPSQPVSTTVPSPAVGPSAPVLAGSIDDNEKWDDYVRYVRSFDREPGASLVQKIPVDDRVVVHVVDAKNRAVAGATVRVQQGGSALTTRQTTSDGRTLFLARSADANESPRAADLTYVAEKDGASGWSMPDRNSREVRIILDREVATPNPIQLDVLFLLDATGSMADEIDRLKANVASIATKVAALPGQPDLRFGMVLYRDRADAEPIRTTDFTSDIGAFGAALSDVQADGGGDTPEDLNAGLHEALTKPAWRGDDAVKLVILVGDAPPHVDYDGPRYADDLGLAASAGIKVLPVGASGLSSVGEYVFRQMGQLTMGRFVFLTYGADGASPGSRTTAHVDPQDYSVLPLDELVTRLVSDEVHNVASR